MKIKFVGRRARDVVPATGARGFMVRPGEVVEVDEATGRSLLQQPLWFVEAPAAKRQSGKDTDGEG